MMNYFHVKEWGVITHPCPNRNSCLVISNYIPYFYIMELHIHNLNSVLVQLISTGRRGSLIYMYMCEWPHLTLCTIKIPYDILDLGYQWFSVKQAKSHYLNQCWLVVNSALKNKYLWFPYHDTMTFIQENIYFKIKSTQTLVHDNFTHI